MQFGLNDNEINKMRQVFASFPEIEKVIVFGSRAKGNFKAGSDIDLTLLGKDVNLSLLNQINTRLDDLEMPYTFDLSVLERVKNKDVIDHINRVGKMFYIKSKEALYQ